MRQLNFGYEMADFDLGEMFLNFPLDRSIQPFTGVRMEGIATNLEAIYGVEFTKQYLAWTRLLMGFRPSPYLAIRYYYLAEEFVIGDHREPRNPLRWDKIVLNLPGMANFDPRLPWIYKWDSERQCISGAVVTFVDDGRGSGRDKQHAWEVLNRCARKLQYLGIQFAIRKVRPPGPAR
jgi:hypothetical protein